MSPKTRLAFGLLATTLCLTFPQTQWAQSTRAATDRPNRCPAASTVSSIVSPQARRDAQQLAGRAQASSIQGDNVAATDLYSRAAALDPTDAGIAYSLGREYEATHDSRALSEYCRFLALSPASAEAANVRQRIADLALALPPDTSVVQVPVPQRDRMPAPGTALVSGLLIPGMGQFVTHNPIGGVLVLAVSAGAAYWGLQSQMTTTQITNTAIDPLGHPYQYQTTGTVSTRPHVAVGVGAAAAVSVIAAIQAYSRARSDRDLDAVAQSSQSEGGLNTRSDASMPTLVVGPHTAGLSLSFR